MKKDAVPSNDKEQTRMQRLFSDQRFLMILSLFLAVIVWVIFVVNNGEDQEITIDNVPVQVNFAGTLAEELDLKPFWSNTAPDLDKLTVSVTVTGKLYENITAKDLLAELVTSSVSSSGDHTLEIRVTHRRAQDRSRFTIDSVTPSSVSLYFERLRTLNFALEPTIEGGKLQVPAGYVTGDTFLSKRSVSISGPASSIYSIDKVLAVFGSQDVLQDTETFPISIVPVDKRGDTLLFLTIEEGAQEITATVPVLKKATLRPALDFADVPQAYLNAPPHYTITPASVKAALPEATLATLVPEGVYGVGEISFRALAPGHNKFTFLAEDLKEIKFTDQTVSFTAEVDMAGMDTVKLALQGSAVRAVPAKDAPEVTMQFRNLANVVVVGPEDVVETLRPENLKGQVEFATETPLDAAEYPVVIQVVQDDGLPLEDCWVYGEYKVRVR